MTTTHSETEAPDIGAQVEELVGRISHDFATAAATSMIELGDRLGLYRVLLGRGPMTANELADATGYHPRLLEEWLRSQAANALITYQAPDSYSLTPAAAAVLADPASPTLLVGAANVVTSYFTDLERLEAAFRGDGGIDWGDHSKCMYSGVEKFFATAYGNSLISEWIPALTGIQTRLEAGGRVADVGCGHGVSTSLLAEAFPTAEITGFDPHPDSIKRAKTLARQRDLNIDYKTRTAAELDGGPYDLICFFDCLHDMGDPNAAIRRAKTQLAPNGSVLIVEIHAEDDLAANFEDPFSRWWYAASVALCTPCALAQGGEALGNQVGTAEWRRRFTTNGFSTLREAISTPFNLILEARQ